MNNFIEERLRLGFTNANELAVALGVSHTTIKRIETGQSVPGGELLAALAQHGGDVGFVLTGQRSRQIDLTLLGICEAALRHAYVQARGASARPELMGFRWPSQIYNQVVGRLKPSDDVAQVAKIAAEQLVASFDDPADPALLERALLRHAATPQQSGGTTVSVTGGSGQRVAGRDFVEGGGKK